MKSSLLFFPTAFLLAGPALAQTAAFNAASPQSLTVTALGVPFFSAGLLTVPGSVDYAGSAATLTGTTVIGGDLRLRNSSPLTIAAGGKLYVYGNTFIQGAALTIQNGGEVFFYGDQFGFAPLTATTTATGGGTLHLISPRPAPGQAADNQQRVNAPDGLAGGAGIQYFDGGGVNTVLAVEHRAASGLVLTDLNNDGLADFNLRGTLALAVDNAPITLGGNNLLLDQSAGQGTISAYSPQRYVQTNGDGLLRVSGLASGASFVFPIGNAATGDYTPLRATNQQSAAEALAANVTPTAPPTPPKPSAGRYWQLVSSDPAATFSLTLEHNLSTNQAGYSDGSATIVRYDGSAWSAGTTPQAGTTPGQLSTSGPVSGASDLSMSGASAPSSVNYFTKVAAKPLPVQLVGFTAQHAAGQPTVKLAWVTASELNNAGFGVERSADGRAWAQVGYLPGAGNSITGRSYALATPYVGQAYYRLRQVDLDGTIAYSPVRYINADGTVEAFSLFPNPSAGEVHVTGAAPDQPILIYSVVGQLVSTLPPGTFTVDLTGQLPTGVYVVRQGSNQARLIIK